MQKHYGVIHCILYILANTIISLIIHLSNIYSAESRVILQAPLISFSWLYRP